MQNGKFFTERDPKSGARCRTRFAYYLISQDRLSPTLNARKKSSPKSPLLKTHLGYTMVLCLFWFTNNEHASAFDTPPSEKVL